MRCLEDISLKPKKKTETNGRYGVSLLLSNQRNMQSFINNFKLVLLTIGVGVLFGSCEFRETIVFDENKGGKITTSFFGQQMGDMLESLATDSLEIENGVFLLQDFIAEKGQKENSAMGDAELLVENKDGDLLLSVEVNFDSLEQVNSIIKQSREAINDQLDTTSETALSEKKSKENSIEDLIDVNFSWENNIFERTTIIKDSLRYAESIKKFNEAATLGGGFDYILEYTFPYEVIAVSPEIVTLSLDRKTVTLRQSAFKAMKDPTILDLKITFKK